MWTEPTLEENVQFNIRISDIPDVITRAETSAFQNLISSDVRFTVPRPSASAEHASAVSGISDVCSILERYSALTLTELPNYT